MSEDQEKGPKERKEKSTPGTMTEDFTDRFDPHQTERFLTESEKKKWYTPTSAPGRVIYCDPKVPSRKKAVMEIVFGILGLLIAIPLFFLIFFYVDFNGVISWLFG